MTKRRRWLRRFAAALAVLVVAGVWMGYQFPGLVVGRKSSVELLADIFRAPGNVTRQKALAALKTINKAAVDGFIVACALPDDAQTRLVAMVHDERTESVTVPFVYYLYEMYGAPLTGDDDALADLSYGDDSPAAASGGPDLATLVRQSPRMKRHVANALRLFDALFLHGEEGADGRRSYDAAAYDDIKDIVREVAAEALGRSDDALNRPDAGKSEYVAAFEEILRDDEKLGEFIEFFTDFIRDLTSGWLDSFVQRAERRAERHQWVESCIAARQYYRIADYARAQAERKLVVHVAVDGLQGKLLEGLAQLSQGDAQSAGARYVADLVERHQRPEMSPAHYPEAEQAALPPLGRDVVELTRHPGQHGDYLANFKRHVFGPDAEAVVVNVATVDTPTISVRNLPIVYSGHAVAGPFGTGIPNFSYLDRATQRGWYFWGSDVLHFRRIFANREDEFTGGARRTDAHGARTLFERLWRYNTMAAMPTVDNGALERISAEVGTAIGEVQRNFIEKAIVLRLRRRAAMERDLNDRRRWLVEHRSLNDGFLAELLFGAVELATFREYARYLAEHDDEGLPDYLLWYNPWPDHFAHGKGPYSDEIIGYRGEYDRLDHYFGKLVDVYASVPSALADTTYRDRTLFGVVSDHGLIYTPRVVSTETALFQAMRRDGIELRVLKLTQDEGGLPAIHGSRRLRPTRPFDAVVGSTAGGSYIIDLFDLAGLEDDRLAWQRHPDYHELRKHRLLSGGQIDWIDELRRRLAGEMDLALVREYGPGPGERWPAEVESAVRIVTPERGEARIVRTRKAADGRGAARYRYEILGEHDPLELEASVREYLVGRGGPSVESVRAALRRCIESPEGSADHKWQAPLSYTLRPDVIYQFSHLYDSDRAGTINVFPRPHVGLNSSVPGRHAGESFGEKNGTQLYFGAGLKKEAIQTARNGSLPVTLYHWLVGDAVFHAVEPAYGVSPAEQFGYRSLLDEEAFAPIRVERSRTIR
jgi:hypothetical protein